MTTGRTSYNKPSFVKDGWQYYDYGIKDWNGGDTPPGSRPKTRQSRTFTFWVTEHVNGHKVPKQVSVTRSRLVPTSTRFLPPHPYVVSGKDMKQDWFQVGWGNNQSWIGGLINELPFESLWTSNDDIKLLSKLRDDIAGSDFNLGVTLGESIKSLDMITEHSRRMYLFYKNFRRGNFRRAADELFAGRGLKHPSRVAASNFLAVKYGWLPLLNDVQNGAQFLAYNYNSPRRFRVSVTRRTGEGNPSYDYPYATLPNGLATIMVNQRRDESKRIVATLTEVDVPALAGLQDPLSIAWELTPYSFVVDWFIPISSWLQARGLAQSISGSYVSTYRNKQKLEYLWIKPTGSTSVSFLRRLSVGSWSRYYVERTVSSTLPVPPMPLIKPLGEIPSWGRAVTSLALLVNLKR